MSQNSHLELRKFVAPEIIVGIDARLLISRYLMHFNSKRPMIVTDSIIMELPWYKEIYDAIKLNFDEIIIFNEVSPNPKDFESMLGAEMFLAHDCDVIIAIGGGSCIDCAKCISIVSTNGGHILDYEGVDEVKLPGPPLICIPSTSGTAADVSQFAIINDSNEYVKRAIISKKVVPDLALIDPVPLLTMDMYLTACTGMDALTHAIEAFVSNAHSALTDIHALEAIRLVHKNLLLAASDKRTVDTMHYMLLASLHAGLAFSNASLGAVHAMAHAMGGLLDLPHGECNSILLEHVIEMNFDSAPERYLLIAQQCDLCLLNNSETMQPEQVKLSLIQYLSHLRQAINIPSFIKVHRLNQATFHTLVSNALHDPCMITNPKEVTFEELKSIYEKILR